MPDDTRWRAQRFYRDPANGKLMGVCAGVADYFGWNVTVVRVLALLALVWLNVITVIAYVVLGKLLPIKPERPYTWDAGDEYWQSVRRSAHATFRDVRQHFREMDLRLQRMESYVTSRHYDLDRKFRDLEEE